MPNVIVEVAKVNKAVEHEGGGDNPVEVTSVVKLAAIAASNVEAVGCCHCEVSEGRKEAHNTTDEGRVSKEAVDVLASCRTNAEVSSAISHISNVMVTEVTVDVVYRGQKEEYEANPKSDSACSGNPVEAGVNEVAMGSDYVAIRLTVASFWHTVAGLKATISGLLLLMFTTVCLGGRFVGVGLV